MNATRSCAAESGFRQMLCCRTVRVGPDAYDHLPLKEAVYHLPEDLRAVIILRFFGGYTQAETALALDIPQGTVATRQRKALALLRLELGEEGDA